MKIKDREQNNLSTTLGFVDLDLAKAAVLASLRSPGSRRCYEHAIAEFIDCSEPRLGFNKAVVTRYQIDGDVLIGYTDWERQKWHDWLGQHREALRPSTGPQLGSFGEHFARERSQS